MNFNHLVSRNSQRGCTKNKNHYWMPTGTIEATIGDNVKVEFYCKHCQLRHTEFLTMKTYRTNEKILFNFIRNSQ